MVPDSVSLIDSKPDDSFSVGYQIHIKAVLDEETEDQVRDIAEKHDLSFRQEEGEVIIFKQKSPR